MRKREKSFLFFPFRKCLLCKWLLLPDAEKKKAFKGVLFAILFHIWPLNRQHGTVTGNATSFPGLDMMQSVIKFCIENKILDNNMIFSPIPDPPVFLQPSRRQDPLCELCRREAPDQAAPAATAAPRQRDQVRDHC